MRNTANETGKCTEVEHFVDGVGWVFVSLLRSRLSGCHATLPRSGERCVTSRKTAAKESRYFSVSYTFLWLNNAIYGKLKRRYIQLFLNQRVLAKGLREVRRHISSAWKMLFVDAFSFSQLYLNTVDQQLDERSKFKGVFAYYFRQESLLFPEREN